MKNRKGNFYIRTDKVTMRKYKRMYTMQRIFDYTIVPIFFILSYMVLYIIL